MALEMEKVQAASYDLSNIDLTPGNAQVVHGLRQQYPQLNDVEIAELGNVVLSEVGRRISTGEKISFFSIDEEGIPSLTLLGFEVAQRHDLNVMGNLNVIGNESSL